MSTGGMGPMLGWGGRGKVDMDERAGWGEKMMK